MTTVPTTPESNRIRSLEAAVGAAYAALSEAGCESIVTTTPHRTRGTWIVPATTDDGTWNVHIDPRTGSTRIVRTRG